MKYRSIFAAVSLFCISNLAQADSGRFVLKNEVDAASADHVGNLIIFVHGFRSNTSDGFTSEEGVYWPSIIENDPRLCGFDIYMLDYDSARDAPRLRLPEIVQNARDILELDEVIEYNEITFVAHSMGGLVTRGVLNSYPELARKTTSVVSLGTPFLGVELDSAASTNIVGALLGSRSQVEDLERLNTNLRTVMDNWKSVNGNIPNFCGYETDPYIGVGPKVVEQESATAGCDVDRAINGNHSEISKPDNVEHPSHRLLRLAVSRHSADRARRCAAPVQSADQPEPALNEIILNGSVWAQAITHVPITGSFIVSAPRDGGTCSRRIIDRPHKHCPTVRGESVLIDSVTLGAPEGNRGRVTGFEITDKGQCVTAYVTSIDDGRGTFGDCRGRSWLSSQAVNYNGSVQETQQIESQQIAATVQIDGEVSDATLLTSQYEGDISGFEDIEWFFSVSVHEFEGDQLVSEFELSNSNLAVSGFEARISGNGTLVITKSSQP